MGTPPNQSPLLVSLIEHSVVICHNWATSLFPDPPPPFWSAALLPCPHCKGWHRLPARQVWPRELISLMEKHAKISQEAAVERTEASRALVTPCWAAPRGCSTPGPVVLCIPSSSYKLNWKQLCFIQRPHGQLHASGQIYPATAVLIPAGTLGLKSGWFSRCSSFVKWFLVISLARGFCGAVSAERSSLSVWTD